jgi:hypothetical protein
MSERTSRYVLEGQTSVPCPDLIFWARWFEDNELCRRVALDQIGAARVSTVFLGLDHRSGTGPPLLFETMVFWPSNDLNESQWRYATWDEAASGHAEAVRRVSTEQLRDD